MTYKVVYSELVVKNDIPKLGKDVQKRIRKAIEKKLVEAPEIFGKPLRNSLSGFRALRVGEYRVIYQIVKKTVRILIIAHRSDVYELNGRP